jgi:tetratricopeptide (TPR) repeat protein
MDSQKAISQAREAASKNEFTAAQKILKQVLTQDPKNVEAWLLLAEVVQKPDIKVKCLERILKLDPENEAVRQQLLYSYQEVNELEKFKESLTVAEPQSLDDSLQTASDPSAKLDNFTQVASAPPAENDDLWQTAPAPAAEMDDPWQVEPSPQVVSSRIAAAATSEAGNPERTDRMVPKTAKTRGRWLEISLIGALVITALCVLGLFFLIPNRSAVRGEQVSEPETAAAENPMNVIIENIRASNAENVNYYMSTIHTKSPSYQTTKNLTEEAFSLFDLSYKVSGLKIIKQTKKEVVVAFTLTTRKIRGPNFRDNRVNGEMILRQEDGKWKIYNQVVHDVNYLN